ncbi:MAG: ROK family protein [Terracidiphilus sp.]|jgi:glucokinase
MRQEIEQIAAAEQNAYASTGPGYVAGVDLGGTNLRLALADMSGRILARWSSSTAAIRGPEAVIQLIWVGVKSMLHEVAAPPEALRSIGIGVPGITDVKNGIVIATSYLMGWRDIPLRALIEKELNVPVIIDNDVNMAATGEQWFGNAKDAADFVFLAIGTGIGAGIVLNGKLHRGNRWAAGEIGYMLVPGAAEIPAKSGEPGALESMIGGEGIKNQWQKLGSLDESAPPSELNATEIFDRAVDGNIRAKELLCQSATMMAQTIYNISLVLDCPLFVLGGTVGMHPALCDAAQKMLDQWIVSGGPRLVRSSLGTDAQLLGSICAALQIAQASIIPSAVCANSD